MFVLAILEALRNGPPATAQKDVFRRGLFRIWILISGVWVILCALEFMNLPGNCVIGNCDIFTRAFFTTSSYYTINTTYLNIGKVFIGIPMLAFVGGLAVRWVVEGFRRPAPN